MWLSNRILLAILVATCLLPCDVLADEPHSPPTLGKPIDPLPIDFNKRLDMLSARVESYRSFGMPAREATALHEQLALIREYFGPHDLRADQAQRWLDAAEQTLKLSRQEQREVASAQQQVAAATEYAEITFKYDQAIPLLTKALATFEARLDKQSILHQQTRLLLGKALQAAGRSQEAEEHLASLESALGQELPPRHPMLAETQVARAQALISLARTVEAQRLLEEALPVLHGIYGRQHKAIAHAQFAYARLCNATGRHEQAEEAAYMALGCSVGQDSSDVVIGIYVELISSLRQREQTYAAHAMLQKAFALVSNSHKNLAFSANAIAALAAEDLALAASLQEDEAELERRRQEHEQLRKIVRVRIETWEKSATDAAQEQASRADVMKKETDEAVTKQADEATKNTNATKNDPFEELRKRLK